jgi:hypothetical protein
MQFFFLLLFNIFLGAVLYLVISLKLERSATEFRTRKMRKEMDEMISEFNATAERNISLLERKIRVLRLLLEKAGDIRSFDLIDAEDETAAAPEIAREAQSPRVNAVRPDSLPAAEGTHAVLNLRAENNAAVFIKKGLLLFVEKIRHKLQTGGTGTIAGEDDAVRSEPAASADGYPEPVADRRHLIEKDLSGVAREEVAADVECGVSLTEEEIIEIVTSSPDRYSMVSVLNDRGCAIEEISRYSGIPIGEVRLVLNLNGSR